MRPTPGCTPPRGSPTRWPPSGSSHRSWDAGSAGGSLGILVTAGAAIVLAICFDLSAIASIGSAVALIVFTLVTFGHLRVRPETGAKRGC